MAVKLSALCAGRPLPPGRFLVPISVIGWVDPRAKMRLEGLVQSESYVTIDGQSAGLSFNKAPIWGLRPDFYYCQLWVCWCGALSLTRGRVYRLQLLLVLASAVTLVRVPWNSRLYFTVSNPRIQFRRLLRLEGLRWRYSTPSPHGRD
jgi:hypothetical protein